MWRNDIPRRYRSLIDDRHSSSAIRDFLRLRIGQVIGRELELGELGSDRGRRRLVLAI